MGPVEIEGGRQRGLAGKNGWFLMQGSPLSFWLGDENDYNGIPPKLGHNSFYIMNQLSAQIKPAKGVREAETSRFEHGKMLFDVWLVAVCWPV